MLLWPQCSKYLFGFPETVALLIPADIVLAFGKDGLGAGTLLFPASFLLHHEQLLLFSCSVVSDSLQPHGLQHARPPCSSPTPRVDSDSRPLSWRCHPTISNMPSNRFPPWLQLPEVVPLSFSFFSALCLSFSLSSSFFPFCSSPVIEHLGSCGGQSAECTRS